MVHEQRTLRSNFDRLLDLTDDAALEAACLDEILQSQGVSLDVADLLNMAIAHDAGRTFLARNENDFAASSVYQLIDLDIVER